MRVMQVSWLEYHSVIIKVDDTKTDDIDYMDDQVKDYAQNLDGIMTHKDTEDVCATELTESELKESDDQVIQMEE